MCLARCRLNSVTMTPETAFSCPSTSRPATDKMTSHSSREHSSLQFLMRGEEINSSTLRILNCCSLCLTFRKGSCDGRKVCSPHLRLFLYAHFLIYGYNVPAIQTLGPGFIQCSAFCPGNVNVLENSITESAGKSGCKKQKTNVKCNIHLRKCKISS